MMGNNTNRPGPGCGGTMPPSEWAKVLAKQIAERLMINGQGERAYRLQLRGPQEENLGGRCRKSVEDEIEKALNEVWHE